MLSNAVRQHSANLVSSRAFAHNACMWLATDATAIPTEGTGFKPYGQRPKEKLL